MRRRSALLLGLLPLLVAGCPKKDAAVDAAVLAEDAAVVVLIDQDAGEDSGIVPFTTATAAHAAVPVHHADAAAAAPIPTPIPTPEPSSPGLAAGDCCCEVAGQFSQQPQSACAKGGHGQCVKKIHCSLARGKASKSDKQCCCRIDDKQDVISQSVCQEANVGGRCVKMSDCTR